MRTKTLAVLLLAISCSVAGFLIGSAFSGAGLKPVPAFVRARAWVGYAIKHRDPNYQQAGKATFQDRCSVCHGVTENDAVRLARQSFRSYMDIGVFRVVANGQGKGDMPSYNLKLRDHKILQTVAYLKSLSRDTVLPETATLSLPDGEYEYVAVAGGLMIYSIDDGFQLVGSIRVPGMRGPRGIAIDAGSGRLYVSFHGDQSGSRSVGRVSAIDLNTGEEIWRRDIEPGVDSLAVTPDGRKIYVPDGEHLGAASGWTVLEAEFGRSIGRIAYGKASHNTQVSSDGKWVYLSAVGHDYLGIANTETDEIIAEIGPFGDVLRPFALTGDGRFALVNINGLSGFVVADLGTREIIHRVQVEGWPWVDPPSHLAQSHGIALSPDGQEAWVSDSWNRRMHVFDVSALPASPVQGATVPLSGPPKWMRFTRDGAWMHVSTGEIVDAQTHEVRTRITSSRYYAQVTWSEGKPVASYSRYSNSYTSK